MLSSDSGSGCRIFPEEQSPINQPEIPNQLMQCSRLPGAMAPRSAFLEDEWRASVRSYSWDACYSHQAAVNSSIR